MDGNIHSAYSNVMKYRFDLLDNVPGVKIKYV